MADTFCISYDKSGVVYFFFLFYHFGKAKQKTVVNRTNIGSKHTDQITSSDTHSYMHVIQANPLSATCTQVIPCLFKLGYLPTLSLLSKEIHAILKSILVQFIPLSARLIYATTFSFLIYWQYSLFNIWTSSWGGEFYPFSFSLSLCLQIWSSAKPNFSFWSCRGGSCFLPHIIFYIFIGWYICNLLSSTSFVRDQL